MTEQKIKDSISEIIDQCDATATPRICEKIQTAAGKDYVINRVVHLIANEGMLTVQECLPHIEQELDLM
jgi:hypothetical protein